MTWCAASLGLQAGEDVTHAMPLIVPAAAISGWK